MFLIKITSCIPSKALLNISHKYIEASKEFKHLGIELPGGVSYDWSCFVLI